MRDHRGEDDPNYHDTTLTDKHTVVVENLGSFGLDEVYRGMSQKKGTRLKEGERLLHGTMDPPSKYLKTELTALFGKKKKKNGSREKKTANNIFNEPLRKTNSAKCQRGFKG